MLVDSLLCANERIPNGLAVDDGTQPVTYAQLTALAGLIAGQVDRAARTKNVGIMLPACSIFPAALMGVLWSSHTAVPLNFMLAPEELAGVVRDAELDTIITTHHFQVLAENLPIRAVFLDDCQRISPAEAPTSRPLPPVPTVDPSETAVILYTSGTTASPKGVELSYGNLTSNVADGITAFELDSSHRFLNVLPPFHVFGLTAGVLIPISLGISVHAVPRFTPSIVLRTIRDRQVTLLMAIPSMYGTLLKAKSARREHFASVTLAVSGGEPLSDAVHLGFEERFGVTLHQGYGLTETSPVVAACSRSTHRAGTVGKPIPNVAIRIVGESGKAAGQGGEGEILVRGPGVMKGYYRKPEETRAAIDQDGWFHTGDIGRVDGDGFLSITGRAKEMLIVGGENVFAREIEAVLESHEQIVQAAVIGIPDDVRGEVPVAFVIPSKVSAVEESEVRAFARQSLAGFKVPKRVVIREELPTGPTGKILKRRLRDLL